MGFICPLWTDRKFNTTKFVEQCQTWNMWMDKRTGMTSLQSNQFIHSVQRTSLPNTCIKDHVLLSFIQTKFLIVSSTSYPFSRCQQTKCYTTTLRLYMKLHIRYSINVRNTITENKSCLDHQADNQCRHNWKFLYCIPITPSQSPHHNEPKFLVLLSV
jgi:hypothetical protein